MGPAMLIAHGGTRDSFHDRAFEGLSRRSPRVAYVGAANGDQPRWFHAVADSLAKRHGAETRHARSGTPAEVEEARRAIGDADLIYVSGGDVALLARRLVGGGLDRSIRERHRAGAHLVGTSAGAIGLTRYWVRFPEDDPTLARPTRFPCIGALPLAVDVHDEDSDWEELRALLACWGEDEPDAVVDGFGIPAGGALWLDDRSAVTPLGPPPKRLRLSHGRVVELSGA
jgi:peptidase E